jgi:hypothetical protein
MPFADLFRTTLFPKIRGKPYKSILIQESNGYEKNHRERSDCEWCHPSGPLYRFRKAWCWQPRNVYISGGTSNFEIDGNSDVEVGAKLVLIDANYDNQSGQVKVRDEVSSSIMITKLASSYNVSILAEL